MSENDCFYSLILPISETILSDMSKWDQMEVKLSFNQAINKSNVIIYVELKNNLILILDYMAEAYHTE